MSVISFDFHVAKPLVNHKTWVGFERSPCGGSDSPTIQTATRAPRSPPFCASIFPVVPVVPVVPKEPGISETCSQGSLQMFRSVELLPCGYD